ncbi:MAG: M28 family peptidase [Treponema sp.]|nr:M28 family peptidase [Treponema sp.]
MDFLPAEFKAYIAPGADRAGILQDYLHDRGVESAIAAIDGRQHILVQFDSRFYNPQFKIKTVIAHYDRVEGSPGANDNSAANFQIADWAGELAKWQGIHNVRIFFTDGEELGWNNGTLLQGAYGIANVFKRLGITNDDIYVFDSCGRGEVPILARTVLPPKVPAGFAKAFRDLYGRTQELLRRSCPGRWMSLPVPYSDNASFLACGIPAVALTMLPAQEASLYARELVNSKNLEAQVMNREASKQKRLSGEQVDYSYKERLPHTWRLFHTPNDNIASLTQESWRIMHNILTTLAESKSLQI